MLFGTNFVVAALLLVGSLPAAAAPDDNFQQKYPDFACDVDKGAPPKYSLNYGVNDLRQIADSRSGQEQIDTVYARLTSGPMPMGEYEGHVIFANSEMTAVVNTFLQSLGLPGLDDNQFGAVPSSMQNSYWQKAWSDVAAIGSAVNSAVTSATGAPKLTNKVAVTKLMELIWFGKVFKTDPLQVPNDETRILGNRVPSIQALSVLFQYLHISFPAPATGGDATLRFPAKVYCGQSLFDSRRESIIIDYAHSDSVFDLDRADRAIQYNKAIDFLAGADGLQIRDEIRMVRPGLYLGRAYMGRLFVLNFTLECKTGDCKSVPVQGGAAEACDIGAQRRAILANPAIASQQCMSMQDFRSL